MAENDKKAAQNEEERDDEQTTDQVDFASLIEEDEPIVPDTNTDDPSADIVATKKVDLDGDDSGWEYSDDSDDEESEEESYEDSPDDL